MTVAVPDMGGAASEGVAGLLLPHPAMTAGAINAQRKRLNTFPAGTPSARRECPRE